MQDFCAKTLLQSNTFVQTFWISNNTFVQSIWCRARHLLKHLSAWQDFNSLQPNLTMINMDVKKKCCNVLTLSFSKTFVQSFWVMKDFFKLYGCKAKLLVRAKQDFCSNILDAKESFC